MPAACVYLTEYTATWCNNVNPEIESNMEKHAQNSNEAADLAWALIRPFVIILGGVFMLMMLMFLCMEIGMLKAYWMSERVYAASAEQPDPAMEGCLVRVSGALSTDESVSAGNLGTYTEVIEVQNLGTTIAYAEHLQLGAWQVQGLHTMNPCPFGYFAINTPGVNWVKSGGKHLAILPSGTKVTLVGRQRGNVLDMAAPEAKAELGKPATVFLNHINNSPNADFSLHSFQSVSIFALLSYFGIWLLLARATHNSLRWGMMAGGSLLLVAGIIEAIIS